MSFNSFIRRHRGELLGLLAIAVVGTICVLVFRAMTAETEPEVSEPAPVVEAAD